MRRFELRADLYFLMENNIFNLLGLVVQPRAQEMEVTPCSENPSNVFAIRRRRPCECKRGRLYQKTELPYLSRKFSHTALPCQKERHQSNIAKSLKRNYLILRKVMDFFLDTSNHSLEGLI